MGSRVPGFRRFMGRAEELLGSGLEVHYIRIGIFGRLGVSILW